MKADTPFLKSFACFGVFFLAFAAWLIATGEEFFFFRLGKIAVYCLFPAVITGTWGWFSREKWPWRRFIFIFVMTVIATDIFVSVSKGQK